MADGSADIATEGRVFRDEPKRGWFQLAFDREVGEGVTSWNVGTRRLILVRDGERIRCFDGDCPHRGANLGRGGQLDGDAVICAFHQYRIGLGQGAGLCVAEHPTLLIGGLVLVLLGGDNGFDLSELFDRLAETSVFVEALKLRVAAPMSLVIENAFDFRHFFGVHGVDMRGGRAFLRPQGGLGAAATLMVPQGPGKGGTGNGQIPTSYDCIAFSPGLTLVQLGGQMPYGVVTGACDRGDGSCDIRLTFVLPRDVWGEVPSEEWLDPLIRHSRAGLEDDRCVWEDIRPGFSPHWVAEDAAVRAWQNFCAGFA